VGVFMGGLYGGKRLDYLLEAAHVIRERIINFELVIVGAGPEAQRIEAAARRNPWITWVGPKFDEDKVAYISLAKVMLLPALVGLAVVDAFALEVPLVTVDSDEHGPEIEYLQDGVNGLVLPAETSPDTYGETVASLLQDEGMQARLRSGCRQAAEKYTLEAMVDRFVEGICLALGVRGISGTEPDSERG
jgi:glycosyltransferase involved in cell wall biosynthesis